MKKIYLLLSWTMLLMLIVVTSQAQISVTATGGTTSATYTTLNAAINAINAGTHTGVINISVTASTTETVGSTLNQSGSGSASYTRITIKPAATTTPTIQGNIATSLLFILGSNVTVDGSNTVGGTTRDLTINNTNATSDAVIRFGSPSAVLGASNDTVINCVVTNASTTGSGGCIISGSGITASAAAEAPNSNNLIQNNALSGAQNGFFSNGPSTYDAGWVINKNTFSNLGFSGITVYNASNLTISGNVISNVTSNSNYAVSGIALSFNIAGANIFNNKISAISNTNSLASPAAEGMYFNLLTTASNINVYNNFISGVFGYGDGTVVANNGHGIYIDDGGGYNIYYNTIALNTNQTIAGTTAAVCFNPFATGGIPNASVNLVDNIFVNTETLGTRYAIYSSAPSSIFSSIDRNDYYSAPALGFIGGTARTTIANIQAGFGGNLNSITYNPTFASTTDLHLQLISANNVLVVGTPIGTITTDIDSGLRSTTATTIGAHELPLIQYTPLVNTCSNGDVTLNPVTISAGVGYVTSATYTPQIYFKKNAGSWSHAAGVPVAGTSPIGTWSFTIPQSTLGGVIGGDVISYYVVAQTTSGTVFGNPSNGLVATDVNTVTTPPTTPNTYTVNAVSLTGLVTAQGYCFTPLPSSVSYSYTGAPGTPNQYTLVWSPAGPIDVASFTTLPASPIVANTPAGLPSGAYTGTLNIKNATTTCSTSYTLTLTVNHAPAAITGNLGVCIGSTTSLTNDTTGGTWSCAPASVATITATGVVTGIASGTATVSYVVASGCVASAIVTVGTPAAAITGASVVCQGNITTLANVTPGGIWSSSDLTKATVSSGGVVTGTGGGTVTISYTTAGCTSQTKALTVNPGPGPINGTLEICMGTSTTLTDTTAGGTWHSSNTLVATIDSAHGVVTSVSPGTSTITYTRPSNGCNALAVLTVDAIPGAITPNVICAGAPTALLSSLPGGTWVSSNTAVATIGSSSGIIIGAVHGTSTITYKVAICSVKQVITVNLTPGPISGAGTVCTGRSLSLSNGISGGVWTSSDPTVATASTATPTIGLATGVAPGTATITYTTVSCPASTAMVSVNPSPAIITGITNLCSGSTTTLSNATAGGTWSSSNPAVPITSGGIVTGLGLGITTNISYTIPNGCYQVAPIVVDSLPAPITGPDSLCQFWTDTLHDVTPGGLWTSSNGTIASIEAATGLITGVTPGTVTITYTRVSGCYRTKGFLVRTPLPASVSIEQTPDTIVCAGTSVTFKAHWTNGGTPGFQWNSSTLPIPGATDSVYTYTPIHGDFISVYMTVHGLCAAPNPSYASEYMNVYPNGVTPIVTITSTAPPAGTTYLGETVTFYADVTYGGTAPTFQWYKNTNPIAGATNSTYTTEIYESAYYSCRVTGDAPCSASTAGVSNSILVTSPVGVSTLNVGASDFNLFPNPNTGSFTLKGTIANGTDKELTVEVSNMLGQVVYTGAATPKNGQVNYQVKLAGDMAAGNYIIRISSDEVNQSFHFVLGK